MTHGSLDALIREIVQQRVSDKRSVLHNMSAGPTARAARKGADGCRRIHFPMSERVALADSLKGWCALIGSPASTIDQAVTILREAAVNAAEKLQLLPPVASALCNTPGETLAGLSDDPLLTLAVLSRCSGGKVFIRNKSPIILKEYLSITVSLVVPENWRFES